jgi:serine/threonine protein phosphatase 1
MSRTPSLGVLDLQIFESSLEISLRRGVSMNAPRAPVAVLRGARRVWAVGAIHGDAERIRFLCEKVMPLFEPGDRLVFLGNYLGYGVGVCEAIDALLSLRRAFLARKPFVHTDDIVFLRGCQEEMLRCLLELQFAVEPGRVLEWGLGRGVGATISAYGGDPETGLACARDGPLAMTRWTGGLREGLKRKHGHASLMGNLHWAACTQDQKLLFVSSGLDTAKQIGAQSDSFWWAGRSFAAIRSPYGDFEKIVRGFDPAQGGFVETPFTITVDGGCGFGGHLLAVCLSPDGAVLQRVAA